MSTLTGVQKTLIPVFMDSFEGFETLVEAVTADVMEIAREPEVEPEEGIEFAAIPR